MTPSHIKSLFKRFSISFTILLPAPLLIAGSPTTWTMQNNTSEIIEIQCNGTTQEPKISPKMPPLLVPAHQARKHEWGKDWHNDGMGLNPSRWVCEAKTIAQNATASKLSFETGWGEAIQITISKDTKEISLSKATTGTNPL